MESIYTEPKGESELKAKVEVRPLTSFEQGSIGTNYVYDNHSGTSVEDRRKAYKIGRKNTS